MKNTIFTRNLIERVSDRLLGDTNPQTKDGCSIPKRRLVIEALEPRILFSGSPAPAPEPAPAPAPETEPVVQEAPSPEAEPDSAPAPDANSGETVAVPPQTAADTEAAPVSETPASSEGVTAIALSVDEAAAIADAAAQQWAESGLSAEQSAALSQVTYIVADLGGDKLGAAEGGTIYIDDDAAGRGWFVDSTPFSDDEFSGGLALANAEGGASTGIDLLSVLLHEQGHILGLDGVEGDASQAGNIMFGLFDTGERRSLLAGQAEGAIALSLEGIHYAEVVWDDGSTDNTPPITQGSGDANQLWTGIYADDFDGTGLLNGTTEPGGGTWIASGLWNADGTKTANGTAAAFLPFTPASGQVYTLSISVNPDSSASTDWFSLGFTANANTNAWHAGGSTNVPTGWLLNRENDASTSVIQTFLGPNTGSGASHDLVPDIVGPVDIQVVLDTTAASWTVEWFADGNSLRGPVAFGTNPTINYVGFAGWSTATGSVDNFSLSSSGSTNWRVDNSGTVPPNDILPGTGDRANIAFDSGTNNNGTVTTIAAMPAAGPGGAVELTAVDNVTVHSVRIGTNPGLGYGGHGRLENNGGTLTVDNSVAGTGNNFILGADGDRSGVYIQDGGTLEMNGTPGHAVIVGANNGEGFFGLIDGTVNADVSGFRLAENGSSHGSFVMDGGTLNVAGGNFETANTGTGVVTMNSGTYNQTTNNLIVGQNNGSDATFTVNGGTIDIQNQLRVANRGTGLFEQTGGIVNVGTILDLANNNANDSDATVRVSGGNLNVGDRVNSGIVIGNENRATSTSLLEVSGTGIVRTSQEIRVAQVGANSSGTLDIQGGIVDARNHVIIGVVGTGTATISGGTLTVGADLPTTAPSDFSAVTNTGNNGAQFIVGTNNGSVGTLTQTGGTVNVGDTTGNNANDLIIGRDNGSEGTYTISAGLLSINDSAGGSGDLTIAGNENGASTSKGTLNVSGTADVDIDGRLRIGQEGDGDMFMSGGMVDVATNTIIGQGGNSVGFLDLSDGILTTNGNFDLAQGGNGQVDISGGTLNAAINNGGTDFNIGINANRTGTVNQTGGTVNVGDGSPTDQDLRIGVNGTGIYNISAGLLNVAGSDIFVADGGGGTGELNVSGTADVDVDERLLLGQSGTGTMMVTGGTVDIGTNWIIAQDPSADGTANVTGGKVTVNGVMDIGQNANGSTFATGSLTVGGTGEVDMTNGRISLGRYESGANQATGELVVESTGTVSNVSELNVGHDGSGFALIDGDLDATTVFVNRNIDTDDSAELRGEGTITGNLIVQSGGVLETGTTDDGTATGTSEVGTLSVVGNANLQAGSAFNVDIDGPNSDLLDVDGMVTLAGNLNVVSGADPTLQFITIIDNDGADAVSGTFAGLAEGATVTVGSLSYAITYVGGDGNDVVLFDPNVETGVTIDAAGDLVVEDIMDTTTDDTLNISTSSDGLSIIISDPNQVLGMDFVGASRPDVHTIIVPFALPFDDIIVLTNDGEDVITVTDLTNFDQSLTIDGGGTDGAVDLIDFRANALGASGESYDFDAEKILFYLDSSIAATGAGTIDIDAAGGAGDFIGLQLKRASLSSEGGDITLDGEGGSVGKNNDGVLLSHGSTVTTTGGSVNITGTAGGTSGSNDGVSILGDSDITVEGTGQINITGTAAGSTDSYGVQLFTGTEVTAEDGNITLIGSGTGTGARNSGIYTNSATVTTTGAGSISLDGEGSGSGSHSKGLRLSATDFTATGTGGITLTGTGGQGTSSNVGVEVGVRTALTTVSGDVTITGEGTGSTSKNAGVAFLSKSSVDSAGNLTVTGTAGDGTSYNDGVSLTSASLTASGDLTVTGTGKGSTSYNRGVDSIGSTLSGGGDVSIAGTGSTGSTAGRFNDGVYLKTTGVTGDTLTLAGTGGTGSSNNRGIYAYGSTVTGTTSSNISGASDAGTTGTGNTGLYMLNSTLNPGGSGSSLLGAGGGGTGNNDGIYMQNISGITSDLAYPGIISGIVQDGISEPFDGNFFSIIPLLMAEADRRSQKRRSEEEKIDPTLRDLFAKIREFSGLQRPGAEITPIFRSVDDIVAFDPSFFDDNLLDTAFKVVGIETGEATGGNDQILLISGNDEDPLSGILGETRDDGELISYQRFDTSNSQSITVKGFFQILHDLKRQAEAYPQLKWSDETPASTSGTSELEETARAISESFGVH